VYFFILTELTALTSLVDFNLSVIQPGAGFRLAKVRVPTG